MTGKIADFLRAKMARLADEQLRLQEALPSAPPAQVAEHLRRLEAVAAQLANAAALLEQQAAAAQALKDDGLPRVALDAFDGAAVILVPLPPIGAALYAVHRVKCLHFPIQPASDFAPDGWVPFALFVDREGRGDEDLAAWALDHREELVRAAMRLAATPVLLN